MDYPFPGDAPLSMEFSRQEYWSGLPFPSPGDLPDPGIEPGSPALQADALPPSHQGSPVVKNPPAKAGNISDVGSIPGSASSPGGGHGNPLQQSCLENHTDRGACQSTLHRVTKGHD